jgi:hypothetical protein
MVDFATSITINESVALQRSEVLALLPAAAQQITKDFNRAGINFTISEIDFETPEQLITRVTKEIIRLGGVSSELFFQLLYLSDIPEAAIRNFNTNDPQTVALQAAEVIIIRALQKVWFRKKYSQK